MTLLATIWVALAMVLAALVLQHLFATNAERTILANMNAGLNRLMAVIQPEIDIPSISEPLPDPLYSTPFSGRYWQIRALDNGEVTRSRSLWDFIISTPTPAAEAFYTASGPDGQVLAALTRQIDIAGSSGSRPFLLTIAEDRAVLDEASGQFTRDMVVTLAILGLFIVLAAWAQIKLGLLPLRTVRREIEGIRQGETERLTALYPRELVPLIDEVNDLLLTREKTTEYARSRASDLAHGLKTPLAALHTSADRLRRKGDEAEANFLNDLAGEMSERVEYQLRLAGLRIRSGTHVASASLNAALIRTLMVLKKTSHGEELHWMAELGSDTIVDMDRQDLLELVGVVLENASKWAASKVVIRTSHEAEHSIVVISDDGPGIAKELLAKLGSRGKRLDESRPGDGFGLAIASEIARLNKAEIAFNTAETGGLQVSLRLPLAKRKLNGLQKSGT